MAYIPKNRMITDLYTNTNELVYKDTQEFYTGHYWKTYNGKYFTGKNPNEKPRRELIKVSSTEDNENSIIQTTQIAFKNTIPDNTEHKKDIVIYANLKEINLNDIPQQIIPKHQYPKPTEDDYKLGVFTRYFLYKENEPIFLEVVEDVFKAVKGKDPKYYTTPYTQFQLPWTLTGDKGEVFKINKKIVELTEKRINRRGLKQFLKANYLKFWRPE